MVEHHLGSPQQGPGSAVSRSPPGSLASVLSPPPPLASPPAHHPLHQHHLLMQHQQHQQLRQPPAGDAGSQGSPAASHGSPAPTSASPATSNPASNPEWEDPYCATNTGLTNGCRSVGSWF